MIVKQKRKPRGMGHDPIIAGRAPATVIELVKAMAAARRVGVSTIIREALVSYVGGDGDEGRDRAA
jgi:hypothetical protein